MPTTLHEKHSYPQPAEQLFSIYVNEENILKRYAGVGARHVDIKNCSREGDSYTVHTTREIKADVPKILSKFAGEWNHVEQVETWVELGEGRYECRFTVKLARLPVDIQGRMLIQPDGAGSVNQVELDIHCTLPLIGKKAEQFIAADSEKSMQAEYTWIKAFLDA